MSTANAIRRSIDLVRGHELELVLAGIAMGMGLTLTTMVMAMLDYLIAFLVAGSKALLTMWIEEDHHERM